MLIENVFAVRVQLQIGGRRADQFSPAPQEQVPRDPAGFFANRAGFLQSRQEFVADERIGISPVAGGDRVPFGAINAKNGFDARERHAACRIVRHLTR